MKLNKAMDKLMLQVGAALFVLGMMLAIFLSAADAAVPTGSAANQPANWEAHLLNDKGVTAQCFKHEANNAGVSVSEHGVSVGNSVKLNPFNQEWYGDHWALLVIKSSTNNKVIYNPSAGVWYSGVGNHAVSHWIVCKGVTPPPPTTTRPPSSTVPPSTVTLPPSTTTAPSSTTTVPPTSSVPSTTTVAPTTTVPVVTTVVTTTTPQTPTTSTPVVVTTREPLPPALAYTGSGWTLILFITGMVLFISGLVLVALKRDYRWRKLDA